MWLRNRYNKCTNSIFFWDGDYAIKVAEFKNWYAQLHSLQDVEFKVLKEEVVITEIPIEKVDYLKDRPTVEIEDDTHKANPSITPDNKEGQGKGENDEVTIE